MKKTWRVGVCVALCWLVGMGASVALAAPVVVDAIEVRGARRVEVASVLSKLWHQPGQVLSVEKIRGDIQTLYDTDNFDRISVYEQEIRPGVTKLIYEVRELPVIREIVITGNDNFDTEDILKELEVKQFQLASPKRLELSIRNVQKKYVEKGYYLAQLRYELVPLKDPNMVKLVISVMEHSRITVSDVVISGNTVFTDAELKELMMSKPGHAFGFMTGAGRYHELMFATDVQKIQEWYLNNGYAKVRVYDPQIMYSPDKKWVTLQFHISEGAKYNFGKISVAGDDTFTEEEILKSSYLKEGRTFRSYLIKEEIQRIGDMYGDLGYAFTNVVPDVDIDDEGKVVNVRFKIERGTIMTLRNIVVRGNSKTFDKIIRRELRLYEGEKFNSLRRRLSEANVNRLGYFEKVVFHDKVVPGHPDQLDIEIEVAEKSTGSLTFSAGYSTQDKLVAQAKISQDNFLGTGVTFQLNGILAGTHSRLMLNFFEPYFFDHNISFGTSLYYQDRSVFTNLDLSFTEIRGGGSLRFGTFVSNDMHISADYKLEHVDLRNVFNEEILNSKDNEGLVSSVAFSFLTDMRNNRLRPTRGFYALFTGEFAGLGGDLSFIKATANLRWYIPIFWGIVYRSNLRLGGLFPAGGNLPVTERFVLGGINDMRGYLEGSIGSLVCAKPTRRVDGSVDGAFVFEGRLINDQIDTKFCDDLFFNPKDDQKIQDKDEDGLPFVPFNIGGKYMYVLNTEFQFPLIPRLALDGVVFLDIGAAFDAFEDKADPDKIKTIDGAFFPLPHIRLSIGYGIRWLSPIGPIRLEFGHALIRPGAEPRFLPHFAITSSF